jgi:hypothetical protein
MLAAAACSPEATQTTSTSPNNRSYRVQEHTQTGKRPEENNARISYQSNINNSYNHLQPPGITQK